MTDHTHDSSRRSWVASANDAATDFPLQNLPLGVFRALGSAAPWRVGVAIGTEVLDLRAAAGQGLLPGFGPGLFDGTLNALMAEPASQWRTLRHLVFELLAEGGAGGPASQLLVPQASVELRLPADIGDYTDFYASVYHATNIGSMFRPDNPLLPNYKWVPIGYHGRASSLVVSGTAVTRPWGQTTAKPEGPPSFGASRRLDYEAEMGFWVGGTNALGTTVPITDAPARLFGVSLLNDWSARDVQAWEYQPLGPFLAKNFASTVSPWVVTMDALAPFRCPAFVRPEGDPAPLDYLTSVADQSAGGLDVTIDVLIASAAMRAAGAEAYLVSRGTLADLYWTPAQMLTHHTSNGCDLHPGDLLGSGTVSGPTKESRGCLQERTWRGTEPLTLPSGETRQFLEDGDEVIMRAHASRAGFRRIGLGECRGIVLPAHA